MQKSGERGKIFLIKQTSGERKKEKIVLNEQTFGERGKERKGAEIFLNEKPLPEEHDKKAF